MLLFYQIRNFSVSLLQKIIKSGISPEISNTTNLYCHCISRESEVHMSISVTVNREYKSTLFCYIFGAEENKHYLLSLYNAVNNTSYTDIEDIEINTIADFIYIRMKNDVSFILDCDMNLYEHQSTYNPNMPLRGLMYFSTLYSQFLSENNKNIYGKTLVKIPTPRYIVFYNGNDSYPDRLELKLSDAFERLDSSGDFEWTATMLNINKGHNQNIMNKCRALLQYSDFIAKIKEFRKELSIKDAIDKAVDFAIKNNYLDGFFQKHREGIMHSCLSEFNEEAFRKGIHDEGYGEGYDEGYDKGYNSGHNSGLNDGFNNAIIKYIQKSKSQNISIVETITRVMEYFELSKQNASDLVNEYWN